MARCRECNANVSRYSEYCGHCGERSPARGILLSDTPRRRGGIFLKLVCGLLVIGVLAAVLAGKSTLDKATAIDNATATAAKQEVPNQRHCREQRLPGRESKIPRRGTHVDKHQRLRLPASYTPLSVRPSQPVWN